MKFLAGLALFILPCTVLAAGFAPGALFLSETPVIQGDTVRIWAVVTNSATTTFDGTLVFKEGDTALGSVAVSLAAGGTQTVSTDWSPLAGNHTIIADLESDSGAIAQEETATFAVQPPPSPQASEGAAADSAVQSSQSIQDSIGSVSPQVESVVAPAFTFVDGVRQTAANAVGGQLSTAQQKVAAGQPVSSTNVGGMSVPSSTGGFFYILWMAYFYLLTILQFIIVNAAVFYPVVALIFLYFLWVMFRRFRRA